MDTRVNTKRIVIFIAFVIVVSWAVVLAVKQSGMMETNPTGGMMLANYIIITLPALANIFTRLVTKEGWGNLMAAPQLQARLALLPGGLAAAASGDHCGRRALLPALPAVPLTPTSARCGRLLQPSHRWQRSPGWPS